MADKVSFSLPLCRARPSRPLVFPSVCPAVHRDKPSGLVLFARLMQGNNDDDGDGDDEGICKAAAARSCGTHAAERHWESLFGPFVVLFLFLSFLKRPNTIYVTAKKKQKMERRQNRWRCSQRAVSRTPLRSYRGNMNQQSEY